LSTQIAAWAKPVRLTKLLDTLGARPTWYRRAAMTALEAPSGTPGEPSASSPTGPAPQGLSAPPPSAVRRGPSPRAVSPHERHVIRTVAQAFPWYGYKKIALICARLDEPIARRKVYRVMTEAGLLHRLRRRIDERARLEVQRLSELLPRRPNELWQTDVTYIPIAGYGWWYAITVIDYYSRYLLALKLTHSYAAAQAVEALQAAVAEATRIHGPLARPVFLVTDNGTSFIARRFREALNDVRIAGTDLSAFSQVRIGYRMPTQLGLLERFHETLKREEVYWNLYADPRDARQKLEIFHERYNQARPHWALVAAEPSTAPARILMPHEVYVRGHKVNPPSWSRWVGWLEKDQIPEALPSHKTAERISA
jgi:transposase InsO family protein